MFWDADTSDNTNLKLTDVNFSETQVGIASRRETTEDVVLQKNKTK